MKPTMNVIDLVVTDVDEAITFYRKLGLEFEVDAAMPGHAGCDLPNGLHLMLDTVELRGKIPSRWTEPSGSPRSFLAFEFPTPAAVDAAYTELTGAGYRGLTDPWDAFWGMRYATVLDPAGNGVDLYATLPAS